MEFNFTGIRRGNFIIDKNQMVEFFGDISNLVITFTKEEKAKTNQDTNRIVMSLFLDNYDNVFKMHFIHREEKYDTNIINKFKEDMISQIRVYFLDEYNNNYYIHIKDSKGELRLIKIYRK